MKISLYNYSIPNSQPAFGKIYKKHGAENVINSELNAEEKMRFEEIEEYCAGNDLVDIDLYGETRFFSKKPYLSAIVKNNYKNVDLQHYRSKKYKQRQFESAMDFLNRVVNKMDKEARMFEEYYGYTYTYDSSGNKVWFSRRGKTRSEIMEEIEDIEG